MARQRTEEQERLGQPRSQAALRQAAERARKASPGAREEAPGPSRNDRHLIELSARSFVQHERDWLSATVADELTRRLERELDWGAHEIVLFGKRIQSPRLVAWAGDLPYRYSGQTLPARAFSGALAELRDRVRAATGEPFNHALCNRYRNERDSMGFHSDAESELGPDPVIASVSFGATRRFVLVPKRRAGELDRRAIELTHGALLVMRGSCQSEFRHGVPRESFPVGERINVTFRRLLSRPC